MNKKKKVLGIVRRVFLSLLIFLVLFSLFPIAPSELFLATIELFDKTFGRGRYGRIFFLLLFVILFFAWIIIGLEIFFTKNHRFTIPPFSVIFDFLIALLFFLLFFLFAYFATNRYQEQKMLVEKEKKTEIGNK